MYECEEAIFKGQKGLLPNGTFTNCLKFDQLLPTEFKIIANSSECVCYMLKPK